MTQVTYGEARPGMLVSAVESDSVYKCYTQTHDGVTEIGAIQPGDPILVLEECFCAPDDHEPWIHIKVMVHGIVGYMFYTRTHVLGDLL